MHMFIANFYNLFLLNDGHIFTSLKIVLKSNLQILIVSPKDKPRNKTVMNKHSIEFRTPSVHITNYILYLYFDMLVLLVSNQPLLFYYDITADLWNKLHEISTRRD